MPMSPTRLLRLSLPAVAVLTLALSAASPSLRPEGGPARPALLLASHIDPEDCDTVTTTSSGDILVGGVALTGAQLAVLDADVLAVLGLAAGATAAGTGTICVDVAFGLVPLVTVNADIALCSVTVAVEADGTITIGGVVVPSELLAAPLADFLGAAASAQIGACLEVTVTDNEVLVDAIVDACVLATLHDDGSVSVALGIEMIEFPAGALAVTTDLEVDVGVEIALRVTVSSDLETEAVTLQAEGITLPGCGSAGPTSSPDSSGSAEPSGSASPTGSASTSPTASPSPSASASASPSASASGSASPTASSSGSPMASPSPSVTPSPSASVSASGSVSPSGSASASPTASAAVSPTDSASAAPADPGGAVQPSPPEAATGPADPAASSDPAASRRPSHDAPLTGHIDPPQTDLAGEFQPLGTRGAVPVILIGISATLLFVSSTRHRGTE